MAIAAITIQNDLHAHIIRHELRARHGIELHLIEVDRLSETHHIDWRLDEAKPTLRVFCDQTWLSAEEVDVIWWRRSRSQQIFDDVAYPPEQEDVINNDCRSALSGGFTTCFNGKWLSHPFATERAGNKLYQLSIARRSGFRIPRTLVSQDPDSIRQFVTCLPSKKAIVKTVAGGGRGLFLFTQFITEAELSKVDSMRVCPAIYQEYIEGDTHIRLNCFGNTSHAGRIISPDLDWRPNLDVPVSAWRVPDDLHARVRAVLDALELEMGVVDIKLTPEGEYVWLEVNPQGQFLFLEALTGTAYSRIFSDYLATLASNVNGQSTLKTIKGAHNNGEQDVPADQAKAALFPGRGTLR
jgi:hypothetical protein